MSPSREAPVSIARTGCPCNMTAGHQSYRRERQTSREKLRLRIPEGAADREGGEPLPAMTTIAPADQEFVNRYLDRAMTQFDGNRLAVKLLRRLAAEFPE